MAWHLEALRPAQLGFLKRVGPFLSSRGFYLAGGTAIALHLGHRRSVDLDWFTSGDMGDPERFALELKDSDPRFVKGQTGRGTVHGAVAGVKTSFLEYRYPMLAPLETFREGGCRVASLDDLAAMKLSAIAQRGTKRDFVDLHALVLKHRPLAELLGLYKKKYETDETYHVLLALTFFDDADCQRMPALLERARWDRVKTDIRKWVHEVTK